MEDIFKDPEVWLKNYSELLQMTRTLWHSYSGIGTTSDECLQLKEHVKKLSSSGSIYTKNPLPVHVQYQQKAGLVLVSSGSLVILCDIAVKWFELTRDPSAAAEQEADIDFLLDILNCLIHFTAHGAVVCKAVQDHQRLLPALLTRLEEWHGVNLDGTLKNKLDDIINKALIILHNMASFEENVQFLLGIQNTLRVLRSYTTGTTELNRFLALTTIAELVTEDVDLLATDTQMIRFILENLQEALQNEDDYQVECWEVTELIRGISVFIKHEGNQLLLVEEGVLSCLERVLKKCTSKDRKDCQRCHESTKALLNLSTAEQHKYAIVEKEMLLDCVVKIYRDKKKTHSKACFDTAEKVLSSLLEHLKAHQNYKRVAFQIVHGQTNEAYKMSARPRGHCIIINNRDFSPNPRGVDRFSTRQGTDVDREKLTKLFEVMKFKVSCHNNATDAEMKQLLKATANMDHGRFDLFVCFVLSQGSSGCVYGANSVPVGLRNLTAPFKANSCPSLAGKPKLFFIQASQYGSGHAGQDTTEVIPNEADFLLGYCTVPGHVSYRHVREGSWYISTLCDALDFHYENRDILDILTMVNKEVSEKMSSQSQHQVPAPMYTLKKKLIFGE